MGLERIECTQTKQYLMEVERLSLKDLQLKCSKFRYKEEENSGRNIATNKGGSANPTKERTNNNKILR